MLEKNMNYVVHFENMRCMVLLKNIEQRGQDKPFFHDAGLVPTL